MPQGQISARQDFNVINHSLPILKLTRERSKNVSSELRRVTNNDFQKLKFNLKKILLNNYNNTQSLSIFIDHLENMPEFRIENLDIDKA